MVALGAITVNLPKITPLGSVCILALALAITSYWVYDSAVSRNKPKVVAVIDEEILGV